MVYQYLPYDFRSLKTTTLNVERRYDVRQIVVQCLRDLNLYVYQCTLYHNLNYCNVYYKISLVPYTN